MKSEQFKTKKMKNNNYLASKFWITSGLFQLKPVARLQPASGQTNKKAPCKLTITAMFFSMEGTKKAHALITKYTEPKYQYTQKYQYILKIKHAAVTLSDESLLLHQVV